MCGEIQSNTITSLKQTCQSQDPRGMLFQFLLGDHVHEFVVLGEKSQTWSTVFFLIEMFCFLPGFLYFSTLPNTNTYISPNI